MIKIKLFDFATYLSIQEWYREMSKDGWHIQKIKWNWIHFFKKGDPKAKNYLFEPFKMNYSQSSFSSLELEDFKKMCSKRGYVHITGSRGLELFEVVEQPGRQRQEIYDFPSLRREQLQTMSKFDVTRLWGFSILLAFYLFLVFGDNFFLNVLYSNFIGMLTCIGLLLEIALFSRTFYYTSFYFKNREAWKSEKKELNFKTLAFNRFYSTLLVIIGLLIITALVFVPGEIIKKAEFVSSSIYLLIIPVLGHVLNACMKKSVRLTVFQKQTIIVVLVLASVFGFGHLKKDFMKLIEGKYETQQQVVYKPEFLIDLPSDKAQEFFFEESSFLVPVNSIYECEYNQERNKKVESEFEKDWLKIEYLKTLHPRIAAEIVRRRVANERYWEKLTNEGRTKDINESEQSELKRKLDALSLSVTKEYYFETNWDADAVYRLEHPNAVMILKGDEVWIYSSREIDAVIEKLDQIF